MTYAGTGKEVNPLNDPKLDPHFLKMRREALKIAERQGQLAALERVRDDESSTPAEVLEAVKLIEEIRNR